MTILSNLAPIVKKRKRVGRGGKLGGTSGRGSKGQKARSGAHIGITFEGGQMPLTRRLPKRGFSNAPFKKTYEIVNISKLNDAFGAGTVVTKQILAEHGIIKKADTPLIKILGNGKLEKKLIVHADAFSATAIEAIKAQGGEVHIIKEM
jgi:large subunit ribosomal protein L15